MGTDPYCPKCRPLAKMEQCEASNRMMHENYMRMDITNWTRQYPEIGPWCQSIVDHSSLRWVHHNAETYVAAKNCENAGRFEEAARYYEQLNMFSEAGRVRTKGNTKIVKNISVDLNQLLEKLKSGGLITVYKCPNCGGSIKISGATSVDKLHKCEYCSTVLRTDDLAQFIQDILS